MREFSLVLVALAFSLPLCLVMTLEVFAMDGSRSRFDLASRSLLVEESSISFAFDSFSIPSVSESDFSDLSRFESDSISSWSAMLSGHFGFERKEDPQCTALDFISTQDTVFSKFTLKEDLLKIDSSAVHAGPLLKAL